MSNNEIPVISIKTAELNQRLKELKKLKLPEIAELWQERYNVNKHQWDVLLSTRKKVGGVIKRLQRQKEKELKQAELELIQEAINQAGDAKFEDKAITESIVYDGYQKRWCIKMEGLPGEAWPPVMSYHAGLQIRQEEFQEFTHEDKLYFASLFLEKEPAPFSKQKELDFALAQMESLDDYRDKLQGKNTDLIIDMDTARKLYESHMANIRSYGNMSDPAHSPTEDEIPCFTKDGMKMVKL